MDAKKACVAIIIAIALKKRVNRKKWSRNWLSLKQYSHVNLLKNIRLTDADDFKNYFRMSEVTYLQLLKLVTPFISKKDTHLRESIPAEDRLALTLRYLATGSNFECLKYTALISPSAISEIVIETCEALSYVLQGYIRFPRGEEEWKEIARNFGIKYQFWNCAGALDGKHLAITKPKNSGSLYYNYKGFYSIVLMAVVNADKEFIYIDVGANGKISDGGVLFYTDFWKLWENNGINLPTSTKLPNTDEEYPYVFVGDGAFPLKVNLMKPFPQKDANEKHLTFNYRLSRARSVVENVFGMISSKFGVLQKPIHLEPLKAAKVTVACCYLHNYLLKENYSFYISDSKPKIDLLTPLESTKIKNHLSNAKNVRDKLADYFTSEGRI